MKGIGGGVEMDCWSGVMVDTAWQVGGAEVGEMTYRSQIIVISVTYTKQVREIVQCKLKPYEGQS